MRQTPLKNALLIALSKRSESPVALWSTVSNVLGKDVPLSTFYDAIHSLRRDGLVTYEARTISSAELNDLVTLFSTPGGALARDDATPSEVAITATGRHVASMIALAELVSGPKRRIAERIVQSELNSFVSA